MAESQKPTTWGWFTAFYVLNLIILSDLTSVQMTWHRLPKLNKGKKKHLKTYPKSKAPIWGVS